MFDTSNHYLIVNQCLNILHGKLPQYCYYEDNSELHRFYNNITRTEIKTIFTKLVEEKIINSEVITLAHFLTNFRRIIESLAEE